MKKSFGQHFLIDKQYLDKIIGSLSLSKDDIVLEIGAGSGLLTCELAKHVKKIFAIEIERTALKILSKKIKSCGLSNVQIIQGDFLKLDLTKLFSKPFVIVGNIPYNISSKILIKLFGEIDKVPSHLQLLKRVYLMLQLEVAERLCAIPGTKSYSSLTILVQFWTQPKMLFKIPPRAFYPPPKVNSAFVIFEFGKSYTNITNKTFLKNLIRVSFQQRRKKLINSLCNLISDKKLLEKALISNSIALNSRAENLTIDDFIKLSNVLYANISN